MIDDVLAATVQSPVVLSEQHDKSKINWAAGLSDPGEMIRCGYLPEARRLQGESDSDYQVRLIAMNLPEMLGPERFAKLLQAAQGRANLAVKDGKICMFGAGEPWWHNLGVRIDKAANSGEALTLASLNGWDLQKVDQVIMWNEVIKPTGSYAVVRGDNGAVLTKGKSVGSRYKIVGNEDLFSFMNEVIDGKDTRYDTAGAIGDGEKVWMLASMPNAGGEVAPGDELKAYILLTSSHDGSGAIAVFQTDERVVCANTYRNALRGRKGGCMIRHTNNVKQKVAEARQALGLAARAANEFMEKAKRLVVTPMANPETMFNLVLDDVIDVTIADIKVRNSNEKEILEAILSIKDVEERQYSELRYDLAKKRRADLLSEICEVYENERCNGLESIKGSAWAGVNAISEVAQHGSLARYKGNERSRRESHMESVVDGRAQEITQLAVQYSTAG